MLLQSFSKVLIVIDFQVNKAYIMEFLCINRDKPQLGCKGKCQLTKKLKEQAQAEKQSREKTHTQEIPINLFCQALFALPAFSSATVNAPFAIYHSGHPVQANYAIFHPPQGIV
jgi:hypothetical protein